MTAVVIGIDPHKASHTAVAVDERELALGDVRVRATAMQSERLLAWAAQWPQRTWAIENAAGLGYLLAQQLVMAGERVVDVQPKLGARVRLLASAASSKSDPHDARSVAIVALRSALPPVTAEDHVAVMKVWIRRRRHLSRLRTKVANQLHAVLCELVPGGFPREITAPQAAVLLESLRVSTAADVARAQLAAEILDDLRRLDLQLRELHKRLTAVVLASKTSVTSIFGVGPVIAAMVVGITGDVTRFPTADRFAAYAGTAPIEVSSGPHKVFRLSRRGNRQLNHAIHMAAVTQIRNRHSGTHLLPAQDHRRQEPKDGAASTQTPDHEHLVRHHDQRRPAPDTRSPNAVDDRNRAGCSPTAAEERRPQPGSRLAEGHPQGHGLDPGEDGARLRRRGNTTPSKPERPMRKGPSCGNSRGGPGRATGSDSDSSATSSHPNAGSSDKPLPDPSSA
jgi:transposase